MPKPIKRATIDQQIRELEAAIEAQAPASGQVGGASGDVVLFANLPLSEPTRAGLRRGKFETTTDIQRLAIPHALAGRDILGAAKTGSGKTLAFLVPLVEDLFRARWGREDQIGALVVSPTRELALQIFEVLRVVSHEHAFASAMLVGGTDVHAEQKRASRAQVCVCTPGRLLQHLEQTASFDVTGLRVLVLDEADRVLDMGFKEQLEAIVSYMPAPRSDGGPRQTMLFSATQTKSVGDLARLSLRDPEYISVHQTDRQATPAALKQSYSIVPLPNKLDVLWSFIRAHLKHKTICFFSSCSQVRFVDAVFRRMQPGLSVMALHGKIKPVKRTLVYQDFVSKPAAVLLATDIAARGLDFPAVDWVVQVDCPEDAASYIHRAGRTARYTQGGNALLLLMPTEAEAFLRELAEHKVDVQRSKVNPARQSESITPKLRSILASDVTLKERAQKAFKSYLRSVHLQPNKAVFDIRQLPMSEFAASLGLPSAPRVRFLEGGESGRDELRAKKNVSKKLMALEGDTQADGASTAVKKRNPTKLERLMKRQARQRQSEGAAAEDDEDDGLVLVRAPAATATPAAPPAVAPAPGVGGGAAAKPAKQRPVKISESGVAKGAAGQRIVFDDDGEAQDPFAALAKTAATPGAKHTIAADALSFAERAAKRLRDEDAADRAEEKRKLKQRKLDRKLKARGETGAAAAAPVTLGTAADRGSDDDVGSPDEADDPETLALKLIEKRF